MAPAIAPSPAASLELLGNQHEPVQ